MDTPSSDVVLAFDFGAVAQSQAVDTVFSVHTMLKYAELRAAYSSAQNINM